MKLHLNIVCKYHHLHMVILNRLLLQMFYKTNGYHWVAFFSSRFEIVFRCIVTNASASSLWLLSDSSS